MLTLLLNILLLPVRIFELGFKTFGVLFLAAMGVLVYLYLR
ncbi:MAG: hypothetical protein QM401_12260 [Bacillota bacterium]|nr:hypothetical protein [Bacillota bacterium]